MQVEAGPQTSHGSLPRLVIFRSLANCLLQPGREQGTDGGALLGSENASFLEEVGFNLQRNIGFHIRTYSRVAQFYVHYWRNSSVSG